MLSNNDVWSGWSGVIRREGPRISRVPQTTNEGEARLGFTECPLVLSVQPRAGPCRALDCTVRAQQCCRLLAPRTEPLSLSSAASHREGYPGAFYSVGQLGQRAGWEDPGEWEGALGRPCRTGSCWIHKITSLQRSSQATPSCCIYKTWPCPSSRTCSPKDTRYRHLQTRVSRSWNISDPT